MAHDCIITKQAKEAQVRIFRVACDPRRYGLTLKSISDLSGIPYGTLRSYAGHNGETALMPIVRLWELKDVLPIELLSSLCPQGFSLVKDAEGLDHDELAAACHEYQSTKTAAHHPDSPSGRDISPCEDEELRGKAVRLQVAT